MEHNITMLHFEYWRILEQRLDLGTGEVVEEKWIADVTNRNHVEWQIEIFTKSRGSESVRIVSEYVPPRNKVK